VGGALSQPCKNVVRARNQVLRVMRADDATPNGGCRGRAHGLTLTCPKKVGQFENGEPSRNGDGPAPPEEETSWIDEEVEVQ
jgi:hypothetical protein